ncbi:hypothetical protein Tco_0502854, partial [Tanacetum coccineum]
QWTSRRVVVDCDRSGVQRCMVGMRVNVAIVTWVGQGSEANDGYVVGFPDFSTINAQQLQNLLPTIVAQVRGKGMVGIKMAMLSMTTSGVRLGMFWRTMTDVFQKL